MLKVFIAHFGPNILSRYYIVFIENCIVRLPKIHIIQEFEVENQEEKEDTQFY